jgi:ABC-2 type transport system ATP-binding protein
VGQLREAGTTVLLVTHELDEAEALCGRVVAMRSGRVLDEGTPAELVARHAKQATVRFGLPVTAAHQISPRTDELRRLPGVAHVTREGAQVAVAGTRESIAFVGAWLIGTGEPVPADLRVEIPDLESALLSLLDNPAPTDTIGIA